MRIYTGIQTMPDRFARRSSCRGWKLAAFAVCLALLAPGFGYAADTSPELDALLKVLVKKGILSEGDLADVKNEVAAEVAKRPAAEPDVETTKKALKSLFDEKGGLGIVETMTGGRLKLGVGLRSTVRAVEDGSANGKHYSYQGDLENIRLYTTSKLTDRFAVEFNTEFDSGNDDAVRVLDAVLKYNHSDAFNLWLGRHLPPSDRSNLDGPYYLATFDFPGLTSRYPGIFAGRDDGLSVSGQTGGGKFKYAFGAYEGSDTGSADLLYAGRLTYNFWDPEPGYYTSSTYYGDKKILALAITAQTQNNLIAGDKTSFGREWDDKDFFGWNADLLLERKLPSMGDGVLTLEGAYYDYDLDGAPGDGEAFMGLAGWLFPQKYGPGQFQPHVRYQDFEDNSQLDLGLNYVMRGHNARISLVYSDIDMDGATSKNQFLLGTQFQF
jgi:hypothetical protein